VLNGLLRHEVLNALTAIRGYASVEAGGNRESQRVIENRSDAIEETIEEVRYLTESAGMDGATVGPVDVGTHVEESVRTVRNRHPDASVRATLTGQDPTVLANSRLGYVFTHLVENAVVHTDGRATVDVSVATTNGDVRVRVSDDGPGLPESERRFLETGDLNSFENPGSGFGLYFVRFLVESYGGSIETDVGPGGTTVTVVLTQVDESGPGPRTSSASGVRPSVSHLAVVVAAALAAGVGFGLASGLLGESVGIIGVLYGVQNVLVGWITHQFHSIVFGFVFAGLVTLAPRRYHDHVPAYVAIGTGFGVSLWFVAAGVVSPVWLQLLGIPAPLPNLTAVSLVAHLVWGATLGTLTALGYRYVVPRFERRGDRLRGG